MTRIDTVTLTNDGLLKAFDFARRAQDRADEAFLARFPPGATISWDRKGAQFGQVIRHGVTGRIYVRNIETEAEYWVTVGDVLRAMRQ